MKTFGNFVLKLHMKTAIFQEITLNFSPRTRNQALIVSQILDDFYAHFTVIVSDSDTIDYIKDRVRRL